MTPTSMHRRAQASDTDASICELARGNAVVLRQGSALIERLSQQQFAQAPTLAGVPEAARGLFARGAVGAHFRHVLDHYDSFFAGLLSGRIDYDDRARDREVERRRELAGTRLEACARRLEAFGPAESDRPLATALGAPQGGTASSTSSLARELHFLCSHTVHHYAIIAVLVRLWGVAPDDDFGVAPSTLAYERGALPCAP